MKKIFFIILILSFNVLLNSVEIEAPKNVKIISQSCDISSVYVTVVDLSNNEIVILNYLSNTIKKQLVLIAIVRTGMIVNPDKISFFNGIDCPFKRKEG
jgi:hypothetical protein